jgi:hypothetical protein
MTEGSLSTAGTLVQTRGREWVVLPESTGELPLLRPVGGPHDADAGCGNPNC